MIAFVHPGNPWKAPPKAQGVGAGMKMRRRDKKIALSSVPTEQAAHPLHILPENSDAVQADQGHRPLTVVNNHRPGVKPVMNALRLAPLGSLAGQPNRLLL